MECTDIVELLLEHKAKVDITTEVCTQSCTATSQNMWLYFYFLLISIQDTFLTPLAHACYAGLTDAARILLRNLAKVEGAEKVKPVNCVMYIKKYAVLKYS